MDFDLALIIHEKLFPKATPYSQLTQLNEELGELKNAETEGQKHEETGDVLMVGVSLLRFKETKFIGESILQLYYFNIEDDSERFKLMKYLDKAIDKCKKRVSEKRYEFVNGLYKRDKGVKYDKVV